MKHSRIKIDNVYRTAKYIVFQHLELSKTLNATAIISYDTYYARTKERDDLYEDLFKSRIYLNGKRLTSTMYHRKYIE